jgi:DNA-binding PadR family transcriptional regulator
LQKCGKKILTHISGGDIMVSDISGYGITVNEITVAEIVSADLSNGTRNHGMGRVIMPENQERSALTEAVYYILLALHKPMHGYGIMQFIREISGGRLSLGAGTLYGAIGTLMEKGWIRAIENDWDSRKKEYEITDRGRQVVLDEIGRLQELLDNGNRIVKGDGL